MWWYKPIIPTLRRWRQKYQEFKVALGYVVSSRPINVKRKKQSKQANKNPKLYDIHMYTCMMTYSKTIKKLLHV